MNHFIKTLLDMLPSRKGNGVDLDGEIKLDLFQKKVGVNFKNIELLVGALTHKSYLRKLETSSPDVSIFERMEFLGDSILGLVVARELFLKYPQQQEGDLSRMKSQIVSEKYLALKAIELDLGEFIRMSSEEIRNGGKKRPSILSDAMESLICAIYLDAGLQKATSFIKKFILAGFEDIITKDTLTNYKSILQEFCQSKYPDPPFYKVVAEEGPDHDKLFKVEVYMNHEMIGSGTGTNKKSAQQDAAREACRKLAIC